MLCRGLSGLGPSVVRVGRGWRVPNAYSLVPRMAGRRCAASGRWELRFLPHVPVATFCVRTTVAIAPADPNAVTGCLQRHPLRAATV